MNHWECPATELHPDREWVLKMLRYKEGRTQAAEQALAVIDAARYDAVRVAVPAGVWQLVETITVTATTVTVMGHALSATKLAAHVSGCDAAVLLGVTIGPGIEGLTAELFAADKYTQATVVDVWGSALAEAAVEKMHNELTCRLRAEGYTLTSRFSPGYGDWVQTDNLWLLAALDDIGIAATPAGMLHPQKSITAIIGLQKTA